MRTSYLKNGLVEVVFFLVFDSGNQDVAFGQVSESGYVSAAAKINDGFAQVNPSLFGAESFWCNCNFFERITNDSNGSLCDIFVLCGQKVMKPLQV